MKKKSTLFLTQAAVIAALYVALTYVSSALGLAYNAIQFRLSEILREKIEKEGMTPLLRDVEIPLSGVLSEMERRGFKINWIDATLPMEEKINRIKALWQ